MRTTLLRMAAIALGALLTLGALSPSAYAQVPGSDIMSGVSAAPCPVPPQGFDILKASIDELHYYNLPLPPQGSAIERANWAKDFQHLTSRFCGNGTPISAVHDPLNQINQGALPFNSYKQSPFWSGYFATTSGVTLTKGKWWVPTYCCSPSNSAAVQWVGIGGEYGSSLFQAGTETDPSASYSFWWEAYPNAVRYGGPSVSPGNEVYVEVDFNRTCSNQPYAFMYNYATGLYWGITCQSYTPDRGSAEWIVERSLVQCGSGFHPTYLTQTTQVDWHGTWADSTSTGNTDHTISYFNNTEEDMVDNGNFLESSSLLGTGSDGASTFTSTYDNNHGTYCG